MTSSDDRIWTALFLLGGMFQEQGRFHVVVSFGWSGQGYWMKLGVIDALYPTRTVGGSGQHRPVAAFDGTTDKVDIAQWMAPRK